MLHSFFKKSIATILSILLIFSLFHPIAATASEKDTINISVRIESWDKTVAPLTTIELAPYDITRTVGNNKVGNWHLTNDQPLAIHAIIKALELQGLDVTKKSVIDVGYQGNYIAGVNNVYEFDYGFTSGWMYKVNGVSPSVGVGTYELSNNDIVELYYIGDMMNHHFGKIAASATEVKEGDEVTFTVTGEPANWGTPPPDEAIADATILINGEKSEFKTDQNGRASIPLTNVGTYWVTAEKFGANSYNMIRPTPIKVVVTEKLPLVQAIDPVESVEVPFGTSKEDALLHLTPTTNLTDSKGNKHEVQLSWSIDGFNSTLSGEYTATGTFSLPANIEQGSVALLVTTVVKVAEQATPTAPQRELPEISTWATQISKWILKNTDFSQHDNFNDWDAIALARSGHSVPEQYYGTLVDYVTEREGNFRLVTDYERMAIAVAAIGKDPTDVAGYNFIEKIYNHERLTNQGTNGVTYALIALDTFSYEIPEDALWNRDSLVDWLLDQQNDDGGFPLAKGSISDVDVTAMTLQALSNYQTDERVQTATERAVAWLAETQLSNGGYKLWGVENSESVSQVIIALSSLKIEVEDGQFIKPEGDLLSALYAYANEDGGMAHTLGDESNYMASHQALMALAAYERNKNGKASLYNMQDVHEEEEVESNPRDDKEEEKPGKEQPKPEQQPEGKQQEEAPKNNANNENKEEGKKESNKAGSNTGDVKNKLPKTATSIYQFLLLGFALLLIGTFLYRLQARKG
ncbi:DUF4430 domain-containing protein [Sutcliffiella cohnii]|uniref:DUF4430 domain-containing protein n=1 Tax=Sutcliffiella cohnii TaxID=33932 RepID=UPI002E1DAFF9|nr:DUF4430 domain-containing protein [Sutcliffiella cohnii]